MMFLPKDPSRRAEAQRFCDQEAQALGLTSVGWREVPIDSAVLGPLARETAPAIQQWLVHSAVDADALESLLLRLRRRVGARVRQEFGAEGARDFYVASLSRRGVTG